MKKLNQFALSLLACTLGSSLHLTAAPVAAAPALKIGDATPEFKVGQWYKGGPVTLEADKAYIVECWATWCGPCVAAFPHLSELAKANEGKLTVIGVGVWEKKTPAEVQTFVDGQGDKMSYNVVADSENTIATKWLKAASEKMGIPTAFVVNKGKIAWIGHPATLEQKLLTSILDGTFDVAAAAKDAEKQAELENYFSENVGPMLQKGDFPGAISALEEMKKKFPAEAGNIDKHIARMKAQLPKDAPAAK